MGDDAVRRADLASSWKGAPKLVATGDPDNLVAACFETMKLLPARFMIERAIDTGDVKPDTWILESSSGTMAYALAIVCRELNLHLLIVSGESIGRGLRSTIEGLGAVVDQVREVPGQGIQEVRMERLRELARQYGNCYWPSQYHNPNNGLAYARLAAYIIDTIGWIDCLVGPVGTGGSMCGTSGFLRGLIPSLRVIGVDTQGSVSFGQPDGLRLLGGLGNSIRPANLRHEDFDEVQWVTGAEAFLATVQLHASTSLRQGPTSGASWLVARWYAINHPEETVVCIMPDEGVRYLDTVYNEQWRGRNAPLRELPNRPVEMGPNLREAGQVWTRFPWGRRRLEEVLGHPPSPAIGEPTM
jgi:S-sulfo-L-cysteine synthase (3-phospho-L-serine-dependent)